MAKIVVDVMLKPEIHDPQGEAIAGACHRLGFTEVLSVRQGKRFEVEIADSGGETADSGGETADSGGETVNSGEPGPTERPSDARASNAGEARVPGVGAAQSVRIAELAAELLANPVIEEFAIHGP